MRVNEDAVSLNKELLSTGVNPAAIFPDFWSSFARVQKSTPSSAHRVNIAGTWGGGSETFASLTGSACFSPEQISLHHNNCDTLPVLSNKLTLPFSTPGPVSRFPSPERRDLREKRKEEGEEGEGDDGDGEDEKPTSQLIPPTKRTTYLFSEIPNYERQNLGWQMCLAFMELIPIGSALSANRYAMEMQLQRGYDSV